MDKLKLLVLTSILLTIVSGAIATYFSFSYPCGYSGYNESLITLLQYRPLFFHLTWIGGITWIVSAFFMSRKYKRPLWLFLSYAGTGVLILFLFFLTATGVFCPTQERIPCNPCFGGSDFAYQDYSNG